MIKHFLLTLSVLTLFVTSATHAQSTFEIDGVNYKITQEADEANTFGTVMVIARDAAFYEGEVNIPNAVKNSDGEYADTYKVTAIDNGAFKDCMLLQSVKVPASVETIGEEAFRNCKALEKVTLATGNLKTMGHSAFKGSGLKSIALPEGVVDLPHNCFNDCENLESVKLPSTLKTIGTSAFRCPMLKNITLPAGLQEIMQDAFNSSGLESIELPVKIVRIPLYCFSNCTNLKTVKLSPYTHTIDGAAFSGCSSLEQIELPKSLTTLSGGCFAGCAALQAIEIPSSIKQIPTNCFRKCTALTKVTLTGNITAIGGGAFSECKNLSEVIGLAKDANIAIDAFKGCKGLNPAETTNSAKTINIAKSSDIHKDLVLENIEQTAKETILSFRYTVNVKEGAALPPYVEMHKSEEGNDYHVSLPMRLTIKTGGEEFCSSWKITDCKTDFKKVYFSFNGSRAGSFVASDTPITLQFKVVFRQVIPFHVKSFDLYDGKEVVMKDIRL